MTDKEEKRQRVTLLSRKQQMSDFCKIDLKMEAISTVVRQFISSTKLIVLLLCLPTSWFPCFILFYYFFKDYQQPLAKINIQLKILIEKRIFIINVSLAGINHSSALGQLSYKRGKEIDTNFNFGHTRCSLNNDSNYLIRFLHRL